MYALPSHARRADQAGLSLLIQQHEILRLSVAADLQWLRILPRDDEPTRPVAYQRSGSPTEITVVIFGVRYLGRTLVVRGRGMALIYIVFSETNRFLWRTARMRRGNIWFKYSTADGDVAALVATTQA